MKIKDIKNIEKTFYEFDETNRLTKITLEYNNPEEIIDKNYATKEPVFTKDFMSKVASSISRASAKYDIDITVRFDDMGGYTEEELKDIFCDNIRLEVKSQLVSNRNRYRIAFGLISIGIVFFAAMLLVNKLWDGDSIWRDLFVYVSDITTTITFWEAVRIIVVEQKEKRTYIKNIRSRFSEIHFISK